MITITIKQFREADPCYVEVRLAALVDHLGRTPNDTEEIPVKDWIAAQKKLGHFSQQRSELIWGVSYLLPFTTALEIAIRATERIVSSIPIVHGRHYTWSEAQRELCLKGISCVRGNFGNTELYQVFDELAGMQKTAFLLCRIEDEKNWPPSEKSKALGRVACALHATKSLVLAKFRSGRVAINNSLGWSVAHSGEASAVYETLVSDILELTGKK